MPTLKPTKLIPAMLRNTRPIRSVRDVALIHRKATRDTRYGPILRQMNKSKMWQDVRRDWSGIGMGATALSVGVVLSAWLVL